MKEGLLNFNLTNLEAKISCAFFIVSISSNFDKKYNYCMSHMIHGIKISLTH